MEKVRVGVIGLGFFGEKHAQVLSDMQGVELAAVCTRRPGRLKEVAETYNAGKSYTDYKQLLADEEIDAVNVVTHYHDHHQIAVDAVLDQILQITHVGYHRQQATHHCLHRCQRQTF